MLSDCPLCESKSFHFWYQELHSRDFYLCPECDLRFVDRKQLMKETEEKSHYEQHNNSTLSAGYEKFLNRLSTFVENKYSKDSRGLDYGSGPFPMLNKLLTSKGFKNLYYFDPFFAPAENYKKMKFEFITICEVIEHISGLKKEFNELCELLKNEGAMVISTGIYNEKIEFSSWYYHLDKSHINFFSEKTFQWISKEFALKFSTPEVAPVEIMDETPIVIIDANNASGIYSLQTGAYSIMENAESQKINLIIAGFSARINELYKSNRTLYAVRIGHYDNKKEAQKVGAQIKAKLGINTIVITNN